MTTAEEHGWVQERAGEEEAPSEEPWVGWRERGLDDGQGVGRGGGGGGEEEPEPADEV